MNKREFKNSLLFFGKIFKFCAGLGFILE
jgi:hypothetical protein